MKGLAIWKQRCPCVRFGRPQLRGPVSAPPCDSLTVIRRKCAKMSDSREGTYALITASIVRMATEIRSFIAMATLITRSFRYQHRHRHWYRHQIQHRHQHKRH
ncbi:unnamed protein product [Protopolystoma xenopodis]|uniref:Uncharacterized protein n=1 Tax=Protopolystoma xenopodis TaxID=117903 RepID=A0A3S5B6C9_9PLAT|nr:unnamed protein product [Protopolystoma xenopodis]